MRRYLGWREHLDVSALFSVKGKTALVTGGSRGIGELIVRGLAAAGCRVYIASRSKAACNKLAAELTAAGHDVVAMPADLSTVDGCRSLRAQFTDREISLDILIANAGTTWSAPFDEFPVEGWDKVVSVNLRSVFLLVQGLSGVLRQGATADDPARVITIGSGDGIRTPRHEAFAYTAAKAGLHQFSRHLAQEFVRHHVTVNTIAPGYFRSKMTKWVFDDPDTYSEIIGTPVPMGRPGSAEDIVGPVIWLCSRAGAYVTGTVIPIDGGYTNQ